MDALKFCPKCERVKDDRDFYPDPSRKGGLSSYCSVCSKARCADRYKKNKETHNAKGRAYYASHKAKINLMCAKWVAEHREQVNVYQKEYALANRPMIRAHKEKWRKNNPDKQAAREKRRREYTLRATPPWANKAKMVLFYKLAKALSGDDAQYHVDHIVPLKSKFVCGLHVDYNLEVVSADYNAAKGNSYWPYGYGEHDIENLQHNRMS